MRLPVSDAVFSITANAPAALGTKARITAFPQSRVLPEAAGALPKTGIVSVLGNASEIKEVRK